MIKNGKIHIYSGTVCSFYWEIENVSIYGEERTKTGFYRGSK